MMFSLTFNLFKLLKLFLDSGPTNIRIETKSDTGFRVAWDLPETPSCYGAADIILMILKKVGR